MLQRTLSVKEGYYSVTHDAGQKNDEYQISETLYLESGGTLFEIMNKKELNRFFGEYGGEVEDFIKKNNLRIKKADELAKAIDYYNSLLIQ
jgi:hypothetical protein